LLSGVALLLSAVPATAQSGLGGGSLGGGIGGGLTGGGLSSGLGGSGILGGTGSFIGGSSLGGTSGAGGGFLGATSGTSSNRSGTSGRQSIGSTSFMGPYYGNPLSLGIAGSNGTLPTSPTFGTTLYTVTGTSGGASGGSSYGGLAGSTGSVGGTATAATNTMGASSVGIRRAPAYATTLGFQPRFEAPARVQANVQQYLARSERLPSRGDIRVEVDGPTVVLRGAVADEHERRLAEALARLTPGVRDLRNELNVRGGSTAAAEP
jgi:hypothetical protein